MNTTGIVSYAGLGSCGRLGNQLWQIASTIGIAGHRGAGPAFPRWEYEPYFRVPEWMFYDELPSEHFTDLTVSAEGQVNYLQELRHFEYLDEEDGTVRAMFQPSVAAMEELQRRFPTFWLKEHVTAVHVRRGDYVSLPQHFPLPTLDYFRRSRDIVADQEPDTCFLIFSDDPGWCQDNMDSVFGDYDHEYVIGVPRPVEIADRQGDPEDQYDLQLMSFCDRHIISNSTFSWWGAYLSQDAEILHPDVWFGKHRSVCQIPWRRMFNDRFREVPT